MAPVFDRYVDVLIVGAGLSGIGAACHLKEQFPQRSLEILESRGAIGGTWDLFRYPAVRSDSDMFTLGYAFEPWTDAKAIADGASILRYIKDTAQEHQIESLITFGRRAVKAQWSSDDALWTVSTHDQTGKEAETIRCSWLWGATGYYRYDQGYAPNFPEQSSFKGELLHPQFWPPEFDANGRDIVVIGSGATAITLVPALAAQGAKVTMLQRSPS